MFVFCILYLALKVILYFLLPLYYFLFTKIHSASSATYIRSSTHHHSICIRYILTFCRYFLLTHTNFSPHFLIFYVFIIFIF